MLKLKSYTLSPKGGWKYRQPQTGWQIENPLGETFDSAVTKIIRHRAANPGFKFKTDRETVEVDLENYTTARLSGNAKYVRSTKDGTEPKPATRSVARRRGGCKTCGKKRR